MRARSRKGGHIHILSVSAAGLGARSVCWVEKGRWRGEGGGKGREGQTDGGREGGTLIECDQVLQVREGESC